MPLTRCPRCGKLFNNAEGPVHPDFIAEEEADYEKIRAYLGRHPRCNVEEAAAGAKVEVDCVKRMVSQGFLEMLTQDEVQKREKQLSERDLLRLNQDLAKEMSKIELPSKKDVEFGGTVRSVLHEKRGK